VPFPLRLLIARKIGWKSARKIPGCGCVDKLKAIAEAIAESWRSAGGKHGTDKR
jgi:hypothetical protein